MEDPAPTCERALIARPPLAPIAWQDASVDGLDQASTQVRAAALAVIAIGLALGAGCDGEIAIDCSGRSATSCVDDGACWLTRDGCLPRCEEDADCPDASTCREVSLTKPSDVLEDNAWTTDRVCMALGSTLDEGSTIDESSR